MAGAPTGNQNASKGRRWAKAIEDAIASRAHKNGKTPTEALAELANQLIEKVAEGDLPAIKELGDRIDGKSAQSVTLSGDQENPVVTEVRRTIVDPKHTDS